MSKIFLIIGEDTDGFHSTYYNLGYCESEKEAEKVVEQLTEIYADVQRHREAKRIYEQMLREELPEIPKPKGSSDANEMREWLHKVNEQKNELEQELATGWRINFMDENTHPIVVYYLNDECWWSEGMSRFEYQVLDKFTFDSFLKELKST